MTADRRAAETVARRENPPRESIDQRKQRVLTRETPSITAGIADAIVIKDRDLFFLSARDGCVPLSGDHGLGLYYRDCRYLNGYALELAGRSLFPLMGTGARGDVAVFQLTNPEIRAGDETVLRKETVGLRWHRAVLGTDLRVEERLTFRNYGAQRVELPLHLAFRAAFEDVFAIRGLLEASYGRLEAPRWRNHELRFVYQGSDGVRRELFVRFETAPERVERGTASFLLVLDPHDETDLALTFTVSETGRESSSTIVRRRQDTPRRDGASDLLRSEDAAAWLARFTRIESEELLLDAAIDRSLRDLHLLRSTIEGFSFFAAGIPWFATLFGRDSLISALQVLAYRPAVAADTLRLLARHQATETDEWRDAEPGKILHELRVGELARLGEIPHTPYFGTVDATPLFLILLARHAAWTGTLALFEELRPSVEAALLWIDRHGDRDGDGYVEYTSSHGRGLVNQGWKDSGDAIVDADGSLVDTPIALAEVQAYVYAAKVEIAALYRRSGDQNRAAALEAQAAALRRAFNRDFWLEEEGVYALALCGAGKRPAAVVSSNAGHALWAGIADVEQAAGTVSALMADAMWSGWGVRTLSSLARAYNPLGYHLGTVWPHDNSILGAGFKRYGFVAESERLFTGMLEASAHFPNRQLPELFAGFGREEYYVPVEYPVACHPQAWAAGTLPYLLQSLLGLEAEAFERRLRLSHPHLPAYLDRVAVKALRVGDATVDLLCEWRDGVVAVEVTRQDGELEVVVES